MEVKAVFQADRITDLAKKRFQEERALNHLEGWFLAKEIQRECGSISSRSDYRSGKKTISRRESA